MNRDAANDASASRPRPRIVLASHNAGKLREFATLLDGAGFALTAQPELGVPAADEPFATFLENALHKARHAARATGLPALADDSGLCVPALGGAPGVYSARFSTRHGGAAGDAANNAELLRQVAALPHPVAAYFYCVLVLIRHADDPQPIVAEGRWDGELLDAPRGTHGFGYDPLLYLPAQDKSAAELDPAIKNSISHRGQALQALLQRLRADTSFSVEAGFDAGPGSRPGRDPMQNSEADKDLSR